MTERRKTYNEKLKDPRWQRKRLEILQRDNWACTQCGVEDRTLHVHHLRYIRGREPWDYAPEFLVTLCADCHQVEYEFRKQAETALLDILRERRFFCGDVTQLAEAIYLMSMPHIPEVVMSAICRVIRTPDVLRQIVDDYARWLSQDRGRQPESKPEE